MKTIYHEFTLKNCGDLEMVSRGYMKESDVRQATERFIIDTGAEMTVITDEFFDRLGLVTIKTIPATIADGSVTNCRCGSVEIHWRDRCYRTEAVAMPGLVENLMGNSTMEMLDLNVNTRTGELRANTDGPLVYKVRREMLGLKVDPMTTTLEPAFGELAGEL